MDTTQIKGYYRGFQQSSSTSTLTPQKRKLFIAAMLGKHNPAALNDASLVTTDFRDAISKAFHLFPLLSSKNTKEAIAEYNSDPVFKSEVDQLANNIISI